MPVKYFDKQYVGLKNEDTVSGKPLGFAVPDGTDSAAKKRKKTVDRWCCRSYYGRPIQPEAGKVLDNLPTAGFKLVDWRGRWSTDNKVARILDPRGFELEIDIPNLMNLITSTKIDHGLIEDELVWVRDGANNKLIRSADDLFEQAKKEMAKKNKGKLRHAPGDIIECQTNRFLYLGLLDVEYLIPRGEKVVDVEETNRYKAHNRSRYFTSRIMNFYKIEPEEIIGAHAGRKHVYIIEDKPSYYDNQEKTYEPTFDRLRIETRVGQMTTRNILSSDNPLPEFGEQAVFKAQEHMYFDENCKLMNVDDICKLSGSRDVDYWTAFNVRVQDGKFKTQIPLGTVELNYNTYYQRLLSQR